MALETLPIARVAETRKASLYKSLWVQVLVAIVVAVILGRIDPKVGIAMKPLGDAFIRLISMVITVVIFLYRSLRHRRNAGHQESRTHRGQGAALL